MAGKTEVRLDKRVARKVLAIVDAGLVKGMGVPKPGEMCVEAAVCYAMGLSHSDKPTCVSPFLRELKISLNDRDWSSNEARAKGLRRLAIAQLGSAGALDEKEFRRRVVDLALGMNSEGGGDDFNSRSWPLLEEYLHYMDVALAKARGETP